MSFVIMKIECVIKQIYIHAHKDIRVNYVVPSFETRNWFLISNMCYMGSRRNVIIFVWYIWRASFLGVISSYNECWVSIKQWCRGHYALPMEKKVPWNGAVSMRSRAGSWETLSICITLRHDQGAPADMHANALGILIICRFPLA